MDEDPLVKILKIFLLIILGSVAAFSQTVKSPDGHLTLQFKLAEDGSPRYSLNFGDKLVIRESRLGIELDGQPDLADHFHIVNSEITETDQTWKPVWGEVSEIRDRHRQLTVTLEQKLNDKTPARRLVLRFRIFNDGIGFRYEFPVQDGLKYFIVKGEGTEINLTGDHKAFWIPGNYDTNEYAYSTTKLSEIDALASSKRQTEIGTRSPIADNVVQTPLMMKTAEGLYINIHEAALVDYPAMYLAIDRQNFGAKVKLAPNAVGSAAFLQTPAKTPWRTPSLLATKRPTSLHLRSFLISTNPQRSPILRG